METDFDEPLEKEKIFHTKLEDGESTNVEKLTSEEFKYFTFTYDPKNFQGSIFISVEALEGLKFTYFYIYLFFYFFIFYFFIYFLF